MDSGTIEGVLNIGQNAFSEGKDYPLIEQILQNDTLVMSIKGLKDIYTQVDISKTGGNEA